MARCTSLREPHREPNVAEADAAGEQCVTRFPLSTCRRMYLSCLYTFANINTSVCARVSSKSIMCGCSWMFVILAYPCVSTSWCPCVCLCECASVFTVLVCSTCVRVCILVICYAVALHGSRWPQATRVDSLHDRWRVGVWTPVPSRHPWDVVSARGREATTHVNTAFDESPI